jgi:hypothetical protein
MAKVTIGACGKGCEADHPGVAVLLPAALGAGVGALVGLVADRDAGDGSRSNRFFPGRPTVRVGSAYSQIAFQSAEIQTIRSAPSIGLAVQVSPHISAHAEYTADTGSLRPRAGSVPESVIQNEVPATSRAAGWPRGIASRRVRYVFSELIGIAPNPWGRVRIEFTGGWSVLAREDRDYYDAYRDTGSGTATDPSRSEPIPGKYYVLDFESPSHGLVLGAEAEVAVARGLSVAPMVRYTRFDEPGPAVRAGVGVHWRF